MKIGLINNLYKPYQRGGAERIVELLKNELQSLGHTVFIISTRDKIKKADEEAGVYYLPSLYSKLNELSFAKRLFWQINNLFNFKKYYQIKNILKNEQPNLVITHNLMGLGLLTPRLLKKLRIKQIHVLHDIQLLHPSGLMYFGKENIIKSWPAKIYQKITTNLFKEVIIVSPSKWLLNIHQNCGLFKNNFCQVIANPWTLAKTVSCKKENNNFIFIGQLEKHKGLDLFIAAANRFTNYNFLIIGSGSISVTTEKNIKVLGQKTSEEVSQLLTDSLAVIIPSRCYENSPTVIYEAAAVKTPAIAANLGGIPELIEKFGGLLFEPDNLDSLVMTIEEFLNHKPLLKQNLTNKSYAQELLKISA